MNELSLTKKNDDEEMKMRGLDFFSEYCEAEAACLSYFNWTSAQWNA